MERYICIHGHFYQPPRENPWLEAIEGQDSAYPYHDWNERITAECYAPNAAARIKDGEGRIVRIRNNYAKISFNFGPTLLSWLAEKSPPVYRAILAADEASRANFSGHGSALAQVYNHIIMPLANRRDKQTQIRWGIRDFESRFGRKPEGMWLAETAADLESLDLLAEHGIAFTVLSPYQARHARPPRARVWRDVSGGQIDPSMPYRVRLPSGRTIAVFFYDGPVSRAVAFEGLLKQGEYLAERLASAFSDSRTWPQIVHMATDGETYGHHHAHGDMALAYAIDHIESSGIARLTNYGEYLERHPPTHEAEIFDSSSWSCVHGVERWRANCGCNSGMHGGWHQEWRGPLREALDWLRDELAFIYERKAGELLRDPWSARDAYIELILNRSPENVEAFLRQHSTHSLSEPERVSALTLLEMQRHALLMFTSCGWFFDELSGLETVQVIQYAGRALQLCQGVAGDSLEENFLARLEKAKSNLPEHGDGRRIYEKFVKPAMLDLQKVGAHYAVSSLFENYGPETRTYSYSVSREDYRLLSSGKARFGVGRAKIASVVTGESMRVTYGVLYLGDHNLSGGVRQFRGEEPYQQLCREVVDLFERGDYPELIRVVDKNFGAGAYTLKLLFRDEQRKILRVILESVLAEADLAYRQLYEHYAPLLRFVKDLGLPPPKRFQYAAEVTLNADLRRALGAPSLDYDGIRARLEEAQKAGISLDVTTLEFALRRRIEQAAHEWRAEPADVKALQLFRTLTAFARQLPFDVDFWTPQNLFYEVRESFFREMLERSASGDEAAAAWLSLFRSLGEDLRVHLE